MPQLFLPKTIGLILGSLCFTLIPLSLGAVRALQIEPDDEGQAAYCLALLNEAGAHVSYDVGRAIQLLAENLSSSPEASQVSANGRLDAISFLSSSPSPEALRKHLMGCHDDLSANTRRYVGHSCGYFGSAYPLSEDWSDREWREFLALTEALQTTDQTTVDQ